MDYRYSIPRLPEEASCCAAGTPNKNSFEFLDAEYKQWQMYGESVANAGPLYHAARQLAHGSGASRMSGDTIFLHVMIPCETSTLSASRRILGKT